MSLLNTADRIYLGNQAASAVYAGATKVWPPWVPTNLSGLKVWLDASQIKLADGATVSPWPNLAQPGAPGNIVVDANQPFPPVLRANAKNGKAAVRFTSQQGRMRMTSNGVGVNWTLAYVGRMWGASNVGRVVNGIYAPNNILIGYWNGFEDVFYDNGFPASNDPRKPVTTNWKLYSADSIPGLDRIFINGVSTCQITTGQGFGGTLAISGYDPSSSAETCDCEVAEVCVYDRRLTGPERQQLEGYLRTKWGM